MARSAESRKPQPEEMEAAKHEGETLVPAMEDAETVAMTEEEKAEVTKPGETIDMESVVAESETVKEDEATVAIAEAETISDDSDTIASEVVDAMAEYEPTVDHDADTVELTMTYDQDFDQRMAKAAKLGFAPTYKPDPSKDVETRISYELFQDWKRELEQKQTVIKKAGFLKRLFGGVAGEQARVMELESMISEVKQALDNTEMASEEDDDDDDVGGIDRRSRMEERKKKTDKAAQASRGRFAA